MRKAVPVGRLDSDSGPLALDQSDSPKKAITYRSNTMPKLLLRILIILLPAVVLAQSSSTSLTYQPATIIAVNPHPSGGNSNPVDALYEVSVKVNQTLYVVVTTSPSPSGIIRYAVGREVLVRVDEETITWNDIMGESHEVPIISRSPFAGSFKSQD